MRANKNEMIEAGIEFAKRSKEHRTTNNRRNAVCEIDINERAGIQSLLKHYLSWKYMSTYEMAHFDFETVLARI